MINATAIREHMTVLGSDGGHVGAVDRVEGDRIKLTRSDPEAEGEHHYLHLDMVASVEDGTVRLTRTAAQAKDEWGVAAVGDPNKLAAGQAGAPVSRDT